MSETKDGSGHVMELQLDKRDGEEMERRRVAMMKKLNARYENRAVVGPSDDSAREGAARFEKNFEEKKTLISDSLDALSGDSEKLSKKFEDINSELHALQQILTSSTLYLPAHQIGRSQKEIAKISSQIRAAREEYLPKAKFSFKSRKKKNTEKSQVDLSKSSAPEITDHFEFEIKENVIEERSLATLYYGPGELSGDVRISSVNNSTISICSVLDAVRINGLKHCKVYIGPVASSVLVHDCSHCVFQLASAQIRIHTSTECEFYLHVQSDPIIEHCSQLKFALYSFIYPELPEHFTESELDVKRNLWDKVKDFQWLKQQQSPNWSIIEENQRTAGVSPLLPEEDEF